MESTKFDKKKCMSTIYAIAKEKGIKIGDLEKNAGASAGYLSKLSSDGNTATPSIELLLAIADNLGVTIDMLVKTEYDELSENEKYVLKFLDRLIKETKSGVLGWSKDTKNQLLEVGYKEEDGQYIAEHPLFCVDSSLVIGSDELKATYKRKTTYGSRFYREGETTIAGSCFHTKITFLADLYVMKVENDSKRMGPGHEQYEVYIVEEGVVSPLCCSDFVCADISCQISNLYKMIMESTSNLGLSASVMKVIDSYMEELPF